MKRSLFINLQVIGAVGFMNQRLEVPKDVDPQWIALMESCWHRYINHIKHYIHLARGK